MPFDGNTETKTITLAELSAALRRPMPWGFRWDYRFASSCAVGVTRHLTGSNPRSPWWSLRRRTAQLIPEIVAMDRRDFYAIFVSRGTERRWRDVTPIVVADRIDAYLARTA